ncbi:MAG: hypothetical protein LC791_12025 [Acidobacteria bacterium]|nr:hypothetical protein [Acidobacteriota bacterium]
MFRFENEQDAARVFTTDANGTAVLTGMGMYAERRPRWRVEIVRVPVLVSAAIALTPFVAGIGWSIRRRRLAPHGALKRAVFAVPMVLVFPPALVARMPTRDWGSLNWRTGLLFAATLILPALALAIVSLAIAAGRQGAARGLLFYAGLVSASLVVLTAYLWYWNVLGIRLWAY